jgi:tetratricopeptide (TPR) repeat protein
MSPADYFLKKIERILQIDESLFAILLVGCALALYANTLHNQFVWDDRAAVIGNPDVIKDELNLSNVFIHHDFWGQPLTGFDSHKSYRPITTLSFRLNFYLSKFNETGFHGGNLIIYLGVVYMYYVFASQWTSRESARIGALLYCFHPVHVEAVASLVGRADALCALLFLVSSYLYTDARRFSGSQPRVAIEARVATGTPTRTPASDEASRATSTAIAGIGTEATNPTTGAVHRVVAACVLSMAFVLGWACALSKEVGATIFGVFVALEYIHIMRGVKQAHCAALNKKVGNKRITTVSHHEGWGIAIQSAKQMLNPYGTSLWLALLACANFGLYMYFRILINGSSDLYPWTKLENHIHSIEDFPSRAMSYAQCHWYYFIKLIFPRYLCFDYGLACIPTIHELADTRNLLPLALYTAVLLTCLYAVARQSAPMMAGLTTLLLPLFPALNILFPVGTVLAERLLMVPSIGFCLLAGEALVLGIPCLLGSEDLSAYCYARALDIGAAAAPGWLSRASGRASAACGEDLASCLPFEPKRVRNARRYTLAGVVILLALCAVRVITRNREWFNEPIFYTSGLSVCPNSYKVVNNAAVMYLHSADYVTAAELCKKAIQIYDASVSSYTNLAIAYNNRNMFDEAKDVYETAIKRFDPSFYGLPDNADVIGNGKSDVDNSKHAELYGYYGESIIHHIEYLMNSGGGDSQKLEMMWEMARRVVNEALKRGGHSGGLLQSASRVAIQIKEYERAVELLEELLAHHDRIAMTNLPKSDDGSRVEAFNQLGLVQQNLKNDDKAELAFRTGLQFFPTSCALLNNLACLYRDQQRLQEAYDVITQCSNPPDNQAPATYNNLALIESDGGHYEAAIGHFNLALRSIPGGENNPHFGSHILNNLEEATRKLQEQA